MTSGHTTLRHLFQTRRPESLIIGRARLTRTALLDFARDFDPQAFHLDEKIADASLLKGLSASGWQSCALLHKIVTTALTEQGIEARCRHITEVRWQQPLRPGADIVVQATPTLQQPQSTDDVALALDFIDEHTGLVMSQNALWSTKPDTVLWPEIDAPPRSPAPVGLSFETTELDQPTWLGTRAFTPETVRRFNADYDCLAGKKVSQWHMGGTWMRAMIDHRHAECERRHSLGEALPEFGPSPGIQNVHWYGQVLPGENLAFYTTPIARRTVSKPGWGLIASLNQAFNASGKLVMQFNAQIFIKLLAAQTET